MSAPQPHRACEVCGAWIRPPHRCCSHACAAKVGLRRRAIYDAAGKRITTSSHPHPTQLEHCRRNAQRNHQAAIDRHLQCARESWPHE